MATLTATTLREKKIKRREGRGGVKKIWRAAARGHWNRVARSKKI